MLKTTAEIQRLIELVETTLDTDRDGVVTESELLDGYALVADELEAFDIMTIRDLRFWTTLYQPGTDVTRGMDGEFENGEVPQSLRARCKSAYDDGFLMDVALQIDGAKGTDLDTFSNQISGWETQWQSYFNQRMGELEAGRISMQNLAAVFRGACHAERWSKAGLDPIKFFDNLNEDEKKTVYEAILLRYYFKNMIRLRWDEDQSDTTVFMKTKKGNCTVLNVMAQHMLRTTGSNLYRSLILPNHITLTLQTSQGQLYFETSGDLLFYPPGYYEKLTDHEFIRRNDQTEIEPWQTLGAVYSNAGYRAVLDRDWEKARVALEAALDIVPDSTNANHFMGKTLMHLGDREGAIRHFRRALDSSPGYTDSQRLLDELNAG